MKYSSSVNNYRETPYIVSDTFANKVNYAATIKGAIYVARDGASLNEPSIFQANGTSWVAIGGYGIGTDATLQDVTTNGKTTDQGITITAGGLSSNRLTDTELTAKSIPFIGTGGLITQDNTNLVWDNVNKWIGIQTNVPTAEVDIHSTTATPAIVINNTAGLSSRIGFFNTDVNKWTIGNSAANAFNIYNPTLATNAISITGTNNNTYFSGFVGINQSGPSYNLDVNGITNLGGVTNIQTGNNLFYLQNNGATTGWTANKAQNTSGSFIFGLNGSASGGISTGATAYATVINSLKNLELYSGGVKRFTLDETTGNATFENNLNIGSTNSFGKLDISGGGGSLSSVSSIQFYDSNSGASRNFSWSNGAGGNTIDQFGKFILSTSTAQGLNSLIGNPLLAVTSSGNLLLGSLNDDTIRKLQVTGSAIFQSTGANIISKNSTTSQANLIRFDTSAGVGRAYLGYETTNSDFYIENSEGKILNYVSGGLALSLNADKTVNLPNLAGTGSRAVLADANGTLSAPVSDQSIKENVQPLQYGLDTIMQLNPVQFEYINTYKNFGEGLQIGNIAQDVEKFIPEAVFITPSTGLKGIDYNQFNGIYIKAIQDQQKIIESLIERIEQLENKY